MAPIAKIAAPLYPPPPRRNIFAVPRACPLGIASLTPTYTQSMCRVCIIHTMDSAKIIKLLKADGWALVAIRGSHHQFKHPTKPGRVTVKHPTKDLKVGTLNSILKQAGLKEGK